VWLDGAEDEIIYTVMEFRSFIQSETYVPVNALNEAVVVDIVILCPGNHATCSTGELEEGGSITGFLEQPSPTVYTE